jgi:CHAT domain-containing protein/tetratricopeptide (TPR) repeat protein
MKRNWMFSGSLSGLLFILLVTAFAQNPPPKPEPAKPKQEAEQKGGEFFKKAPQIPLSQDPPPKPDPAKPKQETQKDGRPVLDIPSQNPSPKPDPAKPGQKTKEEAQPDIDFSRPPQSTKPMPEGQVFDVIGGKQLTEADFLIVEAGVHEGRREFSQCAEKAIRGEAWEMAYRCLDQLPMFRYSKKDLMHAARVREEVARTERESFLFLSPPQDRYLNRIKQARPDEHAVKMANYYSLANLKFFDREAVGHCNSGIEQWRLFNKERSKPDITAVQPQAFWAAMLFWQRARIEDLSLEKGTLKAFQSQIKDLQKAHDIFKQIGCHEGAGEMLNEISWRYRKMGEQRKDKTWKTYYTQALQAARESHKEFVAACNREKEARALNQIGLAMDEGSLDQQGESAGKYYQDALDRLNEIEFYKSCDKEAICEIIRPLHTNLFLQVERNLLLYQLNKPSSEINEKDANVLKDYLEISDVEKGIYERLMGWPAESPERRARICKKLGDFAHGQGKQEEALEWYERAEKEWKKISDRFPSGDSLTREAALYYHWGQLLLGADRDSEARSKFDQALRLWEKIASGDSSDAAKFWAFFNSADVYIHHYSDRKDSISLARRKAEEAIKFANSDEYRAKPLLLLAKIAQQTNDSSNQIKYLEQAWQLVESKPELFEQQMEILRLLMEKYASSVFFLESLTQSNLNQGYKWTSLAMDLVRSRPDLAEIWGEPRNQVLGAILVYQGFLHYAQGHSVDGDRLFEESRGLLTQPGSSPKDDLLRLFFLTLAKICFDDWHDGIKHLNEYIDALRKLPPPFASSKDSRSDLAYMLWMSARLTSIATSQRGQVNSQLIEAAEIFRETGEPEDELECYLALSETYFETGSQLKLEELIEQIKSVRFAETGKEDGPKKVEAVRLIVSGLLHDRKLELKQAEDSFLEAAKKVEGLKDEFATRVRDEALQYLADLLYKLNRNEEAEKVEAKIKDDNLGFLDGDIQFGGLVGTLQALKSIEKMPDLLRLKNMDLKFKNMNKKEREKAVGIAEKALEQMRTNDYPFTKLMRQYLLEPLGYAYIVQGDTQKGNDSFQEALTLAQARWRPKELAEIYASWAEGYEDSKLFAQAVEKYDVALQLHHITGDEMAQVKMLKGLMNSLDQLNRPAEAIFVGKLAVNLLHKARASYVKDQVASKGFFTNHSDIYQTLARILISAGRVGEADEVLRLEDEEKGLLRERDPRTLLFLGANLQMKGAEKAAWDEARKIENATEEFRVCEEMKTDQSCANAFKLRYVQPLMSKAVLPMLKRLPDNSKPDEKEFDSYREWLKGNQNRLRESGQSIFVIHAIHVVNKTGEPRILLWLTTPYDSEQLSSGIIAEKELNSLIGRLTNVEMRPPGKRAQQCGELFPATNQGKPARGKTSKSLHDNDPYLCDPKPTLGKLYDLMFRPLEARVESLVSQQSDIKPILLWSLHGILRRIPVNALYRYDDQDKSKGHYLVERYNNVRVLSQLTLDDPFRPHGKPDELRILAAGVSKSHKLANGEVTDPLAKTFRELESIVNWKEDYDYRPIHFIPGGFLSGKILNEDDFRWDNFQKHAQSSRFNVAHLSSHYSLMGPEGRGWLLFGDGEQVGFNRMLAANVFRGFRIVCLSACQTGTVESGYTDGSENFAQELHGKNGVQTVISTLFKVPDESSAEFMRLFYRHLIEFKLEGTFAGRIEALRRAQVELLRGMHENKEKCLEDRLSKKSPPRNGQVACDPKRPWAHPYYWAGYSLSGYWH